MKKAIIIGAGIAGIASAIRLSTKGYSVQVFEANSFAGGKLSSFYLPTGTFVRHIPDAEASKLAYRFDAGPSLFTMPTYVDDLFALAGENPRNHFNYTQLDTICQYFYEDSTVLHAYSDTRKFAAEVERLTTERADTVLAFLKRSKRKYDLTAEVFLENSLHKWRNYFNMATLRGIVGMPALEIFTTMNRSNEQTFRDKRVVQLFNRYATYNGSNPYETPATLNIIPHLEFGIGAFFPEGGMYSITSSLVQLAERQGAQFYYNAPVSDILYTRNKATGVRLTYQNSVQEHYADTIVSNMDVVGTYRKLLPALPAPERLLSQPKSSSAIIFYWGIERAFPNLELHNIFFSDNYAEEFRHIFDAKSLYADPTVYVHISSKMCPTDAPTGCENWFVMINAPHDTGQDWDVMIDTARANILAKLTRLVGEEVSRHIVCEAILDPRSISSRTSSTQGALYGNSSNNRWAAFLRHANFSSRLKGLYFCGGSVHPGGGIPLSLLSAKIACDCVD